MSGSPTRVRAALAEPGLDAAATRMPPIARTTEATPGALATM